MNNKNCPMCREPYDAHNYHDDVRCLEELSKAQKILREQRNSY